MPNKTPNLGLTTWTEVDFVDFNEVNTNFEKLDASSVFKESGTAVASYTLGSVASVQWRFKKYQDGTIDMSASFPYTTLFCNNGSVAPYFSDTTEISFPFVFSEIFDVQIHMASAFKCWVSDLTGADVLDHLQLIVTSFEKEEFPTKKLIYINIKGVVSQ